MTEDNDLSLEYELIFYKIPTRKNTIFTKTSEDGEKYIDFHLHKDYKFENVLGIGGYGIVVSARHKDYGDVAVKKAYICNNPDYSNQLNRMVLREIYLLKKLPSHPNIIKHLKFERIPASLKRTYDAVYITTELLETNLGRIIMVNNNNNNNSEEDEVTKILMETYEEKKTEYFYQILLSVKHLHDRNLVHRDLKPGNILLNRRGDIKLCDFGFTYSTSGIYFDMENYITTRPYRAPEILMNSKVQKRGHCSSKAIDVWSLGVILLEMFIKKIIFLIPEEIPKEYRDRVQIEKIVGLIGPPKKASHIKHYLPKEYYELPIFKDLFPPKKKKKKKKDTDVISYHGISSSSDDSEDDDSSSDEYFSEDDDDDEEDGEIRKIEEMLFMNGADEVCIDLVRKMMHWDPRRRITIDEALNHEFFYDIHMRIESALNSSNSPTTPGSPPSPTSPSYKNYWKSFQEFKLYKKKKKKLNLLSPQKRNILSTRQRSGSDHTQLFKILMKRRKQKELREQILVERRLKKNKSKEDLEQQHEQEQHQQQQEEEEEEEEEDLSDDDGTIFVPGSDPFSFDYEIDLGDRYDKIRNKIFAFVNNNSEYTPQSPKKNENENDDDEEED